MAASNALTNPGIAVRGKSSSSPTQDPAEKLANTTDVDPGGEDTRNNWVADLSR